MKQYIIIAILLLLSSCRTTKKMQTHHEATATATRHEHKVDSMARKSVASEHIEDIADVVIVVEQTIYDTDKPDTLGSRATIKEIRRTTISKTSRTTIDKAVAETVDSTSNYADTTYIKRTTEAHEDTTEGTGDKPPWWALLTILGLLISIIGLVYRRSSPT